MSKILWAFEDDSGELQGSDYTTRLEAVHAAEEHFAETDQVEQLANGETCEEEYQIVNYNLTDDGDREILSREAYTVFEEGYHGDYAEHNTYWRI